PSSDLRSPLSFPTRRSSDLVVKPDIVAPGNRTVSVLDAKGSLQFAYPANDVPASYYQKNPSNSGSPYYILSGTSMAAAVVSGSQDRKSTRLNSSHQIISYAV